MCVWPMSGCGAWRTDLSRTWSSINARASQVKGLLLVSGGMGHPSGSTRYLSSQGVEDMQSRASNLNCSCACWTQGYAVPPTFGLHKAGLAILHG